RTARRDERLSEMQAMDGVTHDASRTLVEERRDYARAKLARYAGVRERLLDGRTEEEYLREADRVEPYLTLLGGIGFEEENLRWCERVLAVLAGRTRPEPAPSPSGTA